MGKLPILALLVATIVISMTPMGLSGSTYWNVAKEWTFKHTTTGGDISFDSDFTATGIYWENNLIRFDSFDMGTAYTTIGFHTPVGTTMDVTNVDSNDITFDAFTPGSWTTFKVHTGPRGTPSSVSGAVEWSYSGNVASITTASSTEVVIAFAGVQIPATVPNLIEQYLRAGDLSGYIIANYTTVMGMGFFVLILLAPIIGTYIRAGSGPALIVVIIAWGIFSAVVPGIGLNLGIIILAVGVGLYIAWLFLSRRSSY